MIHICLLKEISPEYSLEGLMLKLKLQYFGHLMWRTDSLEKTPMLGKIEGGRRRGQQRMRWLNGITNSMDTSLSWWRTGKPGVLQSLGSQRVGHDWATELNCTLDLASKSDRRHYFPISEMNRVKFRKAMQFKRKGKIYPFECRIPKNIKER